jgi:hypothetical protein
MFLELNRRHCAATIVFIVTNAIVPIVVMIVLKPEARSILHT